MLSPSETNLKLYSLLAEDFKMNGKEKKPKKHIEALLDFVFEVDHLTGCMLIMLLDSHTVSEMVCDYGSSKCDRLLKHIVRRFLSVHTTNTVHKLIYVRYKDSLELLPRGLQDRFHQCTEYYRGGN